MKRRRAMPIPCCLLAASSIVAAEPPPATGFEPSFEDFEIHQYVGSRGLSPATIMRLDSNAQVLMACREPRTRAELAAMGVEAIESQLVLLRAMRMLRLRGDRFETLVPLLDAAATGRLRRATAGLAAELVDELAADVDPLRRSLAETGEAEHLYAILFSYVLDGMAWGFFEEYGEVAPRRLTAASPHWAGEIWGTYPPRQRSAGTSSILSGDLALRIAHASIEKGPVGPLLRDWRDLRALLQRHAGLENTLETAQLERLGEFGLVDAEGGLAVPILVEEPGQPVFEAAQRLTEKVTTAARERLDLEALASDLGLRDRQQALIVAYHELMWDLMDSLTEAGVVARPRLLADPDAATPMDVAEVVFVVDRRGEEPPRRDQEVETDEER